MISPGPVHPIATARYVMSPCDTYRAALTAGTEGHAISALSELFRNCAREALHRETTSTDANLIRRVSGPCRCAADGSANATRHSIHTQCSDVERLMYYSFLILLIPDDTHNRLGKRGCPINVPSDNGRTICRSTRGVLCGGQVGRDETARAVLRGIVPSRLSS